MAVSFVAAGATFSSTASGGGTTFTLNAPAGVAAGDRMYALVAFWAGGSQRTITASGWTVLNTAYRDMGADEIQLTVLHRLYEAGDPASWTATASGTVYLRTATVAAYRDVFQTGARGTSTVGNGSSFSTATINNVTANSWRVVFGAYFSGTADYNISSNETTRRSIVAADTGSGAVQAAIWDSNGGVATGNHSRTVSRSAVWTGAASVILFIEPSLGTPASGDLSGTLARVTGSAAGEVVNNGVRSGSLPAATFSGAGFGQPPVVTGAASGSLPALQGSLTGGVPVSGVLAGGIPLVSDLVGETRSFGVRVVQVEADDRVIKVESRAVAD
jgi:hypothetical protein